MGNPEYMLHYWFRMASNNFDNMVMVSGAKGFGKSTAAIWIAREYNKMFSFVCPHCQNKFYKNVYSLRKNAQGKNEFYIPDYVLNDKAEIRCDHEYELDMKTGKKSISRGCGKTFKWSQRKTIHWKAEDFIAYDNEDIVNKIFSLPRYSPLVCDEIVKVAAAHSHNKAESKALKEIMAVIRPKRFLMLMCIPEFSWLDSKYREGMSSWWLRMIGRGDAVMFQKDIGEAKDHYHLKDVEKAMKGIGYFSDLEKIKKNLRKLPTYFDSFKFPNLPDKVYDDYEMVRNAVNLQRQVEEMELSNKDVAKIAAYNLMIDWDRIKLAVNKSRENKPTYEIMLREIFVNPLDRKSLASEPTMRNWIKGVTEFVKSKGKDAHAFDIKEDLKDDK